MDTQQSNDATLKSLMNMLEDKDGLIRQKARISLAAMGGPAVISLSEALLHSERDQTRWGAAKALGEIVDVRSIPALVNALEDTNTDVAWLAGFALKKFKKDAWRILLQKLIENGVNSVRLRNGAHRVFNGQQEQGFNDLLEELMTALEDSTLPEAGAIVATKIMKRIRSDNEDTA